MINVMIFSKDRASQLELLIRSIKTFFYEWRMLPFKVLYTFSNDKYGMGYEKTKAIHPEFEYIREMPGRFKQQVIDNIDLNYQGTMFFVDDDVFKEPFYLKSVPVRKLIEDKNVACVSLRLCPRINYCYTERKSTPPPRMTSDNMWFWRGQPGDWGYPQSIDGHLFRTEDIFPLIKYLDYQNPNTFEGAMSLHPIAKPYMICYDESIIMNLPINKVQTVNGNHCGNIPAEYLNDAYLNLKRISLRNIQGFKNISAHQEVPILLEDSVTHPPAKLIDLINKNKIDYAGISSNAKFYKSIGFDKTDITIFVPVMGRMNFLEPSYRYFKAAQEKSPYSVKLIYIENDSNPIYKDACSKLGVDYLFIPLEISQSGGHFAKSLCYNMGFLCSPTSDWYIAHDLDILVDTDYFTKLKVYLDKNPKWVQPYTKRRVRLLSEKITSEICSGGAVTLGSLSSEEAQAANPGSTGGSIVIRRDIFEDVGGYDPELFFGYAPEDIFLWTKLEIISNQLNIMTTPFYNGGLYADDPPIEVFHMSHPIKESENPYHKTMMNMLSSYWNYPYTNKIDLIKIKKDLLKM